MNLFKSNHHSDSVYFKSWSRKKYAVFASLKQVVKVCTLVLSYSIVTTPTSAQESNDSILTPQKVDMEEIVVTGTLFPLNESELARVLSVIENQKITSSPVTGIDQLLETDSELEVRQRGPLDVQGDISLRGGTFDQTLILINGIPSNDPQTGHHNLNLPLSLNQIYKIEILKGPAAKVYGPNAFTGVVNFITTPNKTTHNANILYGDNELLSASFSSTVVKEKYLNHISASKTSCNGYAENTDFTNSSLFYNGKAFVNNSNIDFQLGFNDKAFGAQSYYRAGVNHFEETNLVFAKIGYEYGTNNSINLYTRQHKDHFVYLRDNPSVYENFHRTRVFGFSSVNSIETDYGITNIGTSIKHDYIASNNLGEENGDSISIVGTDIKYFKFSEKTDINFSIEQIVKSNNLIITPGILFNWNSKTHAVGIYPGIDINYKVVNGLNFIASANRTLRLPTYTDLFYSGPSNEGNKYLKPEKAITVDAGIRYRYANLLTQISAFKQYGTDIIDWVKESIDDPTWSTVNFTNVEVSGFSVDISYMFPQNYPIRNIKVQYSALSKEIDSDTLISGYALDYLKNKFTANLFTNSIYGFSLNFSVVYQDRLGDFTENEIIKNYPGFWLFNANLSYTYKSAKIFIKANNLFDKEYRDFGQIQMPGRWISGGISVNIE